MLDLSAQIVVDTTLCLCKKIQIYIFVGMAHENPKRDEFIALIGEVLVASKHFLGFE
jgi:hypothetical protein